jgi:WD40 repeat protein
LAVASEAGDGPARAKVRLWDVSAKKYKPEFLDWPRGSVDMAFSPNGRTLALACLDRKVHLWQPGGQMASFSLPVHGPKEAWSVAFSPDSRTLAVGYDDEAGSDRETLKLWDVASRKQQVNLQGHTAMVNGVAFTPDGRSLITGSYDRLVKLWDVASLRVRLDMSGHTGEVRCVACSPDGATIATGGHDRVVKLWDTRTGRLRLTLEGHGDLIHAVAFAPDGLNVASADNRHSASPHDARHLAAALHDGSVYIWDGCL